MSANGAKAQAIASAAQGELARRHLLDFARYVQPGWIDAPHLALIAKHLEAVERGDIRRLMVNLPPRHGKSTLCSQLYPAWYLGRNPRRHVIMATHGMDLSERNSRAARLFLQDERWPFECRLSVDSTSASRWNLIEGGGLFACGVDSSVTGRGADRLILDDVNHDSGTDGENEKIWRWYCEIVLPRLEPGAAIIAMGTRFSEDDIFGRLLGAPDGNEWTVLRLPAIATEDDVLGRAPGEALWPDRVPSEELQARRRGMTSRWFECQFQQNPIPAEGNLIKAEWLQRYDVTPKRFEKIVCALDAAAKTGVRNDYSAIVTIGVTQNAFYVLDVQRAKVEFPQLLRMAQGVFERFTMENEPEGEEHAAQRPSALYVEDTSNAVALIQSLKQETLLPIVPVKATGSKESRVEGITGTLEARKVFFPNEAPWLVDFEHELLAFPGGKHDDMVDAFTMALTQVQARETWYFAEIETPKENYLSETSRIWGARTWDNVLR